MISANNKKYISTYLIGLTLLLIISISNFAFADGIKDIFKPVEQDVSLNILSQMFGDLVAKASGGTNPYVNNGMWLGTGLDPFQFALKFFNMSCLTLVGILTVYSILIGFINTAHEGIFLGKELNNPIFWGRTAAGVIFVWPIWGGYCLLQVIVMWLVIHSVGIADTTWKAWFGFNEKSILGGEGWSSSSGATNGSVKDLYSLKMPSPQSAEVIYKAFEGYTCLYGLASQKVKDNVEMSATTTSVSNSANWDIGSTVQKERNFDAGEKTILIPNNVNGGMNTGFQQAGNHGQQKTQSEIVQNQYQRNQETGKENNERIKQQWNNSVANNVTKDKLQSVANSMFPNGLKYSGEGVFIFGSGNNSVSSGSVNVGNQANNSLKSSACGAIDFTKTSGSMARQKIFDVAYQTEIGKQMATGAKQTLQDAASYQNQNSLYKSHSQEEKDVVLEAYKTLYVKFQEKIQNVALDYVNEINTNVRFAKWDDTDPNSNAKASANEELKAKALINANSKLAAIYNEFEQELIKEIHNAYVKKEEAEEAALKNSRAKQSSITDLAGRDTMNSGNFVSFISQARRNAETDGWFTAGMWYMNITNSISKLHELTTIRPELIWASPSEGSFSSMIGSLNTSTASKNISSDIKRYYGFFEDHSVFSPLKSIAVKTNAPVDTTNALAALAMGMDLNDMFDTGRHPVIILTESGHNLISAAQQYMTYSSYWQAKTRPQVIGNDGKAMPDPNNPASQAHVMLSYFIGAVMVMGFMMAYYIPVLPFLIWIGATLGWIISVCEAIFIAPLWGVMHAHPEGSKYTGKAAAGYGILMSLLLRPSLMILGLISSIVITQVFGMFVNYVFAIGMKLSLGSTTASSNITVSKIMYVLSIYGIYAIFMQSLITKMFNIITIVPDTILKWVGGQQGNLSEYGALGGNETYGKMNALGGTGGNAYANALKERGEMAGRADAMNAQAVSLNKPLTPTEQASSTGSGYAALRSAEVNGESPIGRSNSQFAGYGNNVRPFVYVPTANTSMPTTAVERENYANTYRNLNQMAHEAGMANEEGQQAAQRIASMTSANQNQRQVIQNWTDKQVMKRDPVLAAEAIRNAVEKAENGSQAVQIIASEYVQKVSSSNASINVGNGNRTM